jgi:hypothetical protein
MHVLDVPTNEMKNRNKVSEFGMELYYRRAHLTDNGDTLFGIDANCSIVKVLDAMPHFEIISDFKAASVVVENQEGIE